MDDSHNPMLVRVLLGFLHAGRVVDAGSTALLLGTVLLALGPVSAAAAVGIGVAFVLGLVAKYLAWRVALDAGFFALLHEQPQQAGAFDAALAAFMARKTVPGPRTMESRWHGARRLVRNQGIVLLLQALAVGGVVLTRLL